MDKAIIDGKMLDLSQKISYRFKDVQYLADAMCSKKLAKYLPKYEGDEGAGEHYHELANEAMAQVGDSILSFLLADYLYRCSDEIKRDGIKRKGKMNPQKQKMEENSFLHKIEIDEGLIDFAYHDTHFHSDPDIKDHEKVADKEHSPYLEAIIAAIYYDGGFDAVKGWFGSYLLPLIKKYLNDEVSI